MMASKQLGFDKDGIQKVMHAPDYLPIRAMGMGGGKRGTISTACMLTMPDGEKKELASGRHSFPCSLQKRPGKERSVR
ncbi:hypothetical protein [Streptococcus moroccensis]|uniref:Uncharacterized protein n=1 Tax=Streptococcus moroccensis TaxID=1451356 RepID=A0ABT9YQS9_9STRE|nr:hypothetical protein [Streptococcus moroccensis]MDQ0222353.1 hypothetical protein [Streptococcus moroccensis]